MIVGGVIHLPCDVRSDRSRRATVWFHYHLEGTRILIAGSLPCQCHPLLRSPLPTPMMILLPFGLTQVAILHSYPRQVIVCSNHQLLRSRSELRDIHQRIFIHVPDFEHHHHHLLWGWIWDGLGALKMCAPPQGLIKQQKKTMEKYRYAPKLRGMIHMCVGRTSDAGLFNIHFAPPRRRHWTSRR